MTNQLLRKTQTPAAALLLLALLSFIALGCGGDDENELEVTGTATFASITGTPAAQTPQEGQTPATEAGQTAPEGQATAQPTPIEGLQAQLQGPSGVSGSATLRPVTQGTEVAVEARGLAAGTYTAFLHHGSCEQLGDSDVTVGEISPGADGSGRATIVVPAPVDESPTEAPPAPQPVPSIHFFQVDHVVVVHVGPVSAPAAVVACGLLR